MSRPGAKVVYATMTEADYARLRGHIGQQSVNDYVRALINDDLEQVGEPPLTSVVGSGPRGTWKRPGRVRSPIRHGTVTGYSTRGCRCEACRQAIRAYQREWKARGASA